NLRVVVAGGAGTVVDLDMNRHHGRLHFVDNVGKAGRGPKLMRLLGQVLRERGWITTPHIQIGGDNKGADAKAGDSGGEQNDAAYRKTFLLRRFRNGVDARVHRQSPSGFGRTRLTRPVRI